MLNWAVARGTIPLPRSATPSHVQENIEIYDFKLTDQEMEALDSLNQGTRICNKYGLGGGFDFFA